jgi:hypothetical protein
VSMAANQEQWVEDGRTRTSETSTQTNSESSRIEGCFVGKGRRTDAYVHYDTLLSVHVKSA